MPESAVIHREEVVGLLFTVADILEEVRSIRELLQDENGQEPEEVD